MTLYSNELIVIQIDLTGVILVETDIWSLPADKRGNILNVSCCLFCNARGKLILAVKAEEFFPFTHVFKEIWAKWPASNLAARYIFNLDFYHITVCTVIRVYIYLKNGSRKRRNGALLSKTFARVLKQ